MFNILRLVAVVASIVSISSVALAEVSALRLDRPRILFDSDCTDSYSVPATTVNLAVNTLTTWDSLVEAINPDRNRQDAVQTSGSADGWCDATPWIMKGSITTGADTNLWLGPFIAPDLGFFLSYQFSALATTYSFDVWYKLPWSTNTGDILMSFADSNSTAALGVPYGPYDPTNSQLTGGDNMAFPSGMVFYLMLDLNGAGTFTFDAASNPIKNFYEIN